jgi:hypothetical protein
MSSTAQAVPSMVQEDGLWRFHPAVRVLTIDSDTRAETLINFLQDPQSSNTHLLIRVGERGAILGSLLQITEYELLNAAAALAKNPEHYFQLIHDEPREVESADQVFD